VRRIWDLGSNIGMTVAHLAVLFPQARIQGVEMDADNAALCRRNTATWSDRCDILQAAVWPSEGEIHYVREVGNELSFRAEAGEGGGAAERLSAPSISLNTLAARDADELPIDLVKMDIEGAERQVLAESTDWAQRVRMIMVEVHEPYDLQACCAALERLGFDATVDTRHHAAVLGVRR
jgi:FkbM family methyltransferase